MTHDEAPHLAARCTTELVNVSIVLALRVAPRAKRKLKLFAAIGRDRAPRHLGVGLVDFAIHAR